MVAALATTSIILYLNRHHARRGDAKVFPKLAEPDETRQNMFTETNTHEAIRRPHTTTGIHPRPPGGLGQDASAPPWDPGPLFLPNLIVALIASVAVIIGSLTPWLTFYGMVDRTAMDGDGKITLVLGLIAAALLFAALCFGLTKKRPGSLFGVSMFAGLISLAAGVLNAHDRFTPRRLLRDDYQPANRLGTVADARRIGGIGGSIGRPHEGVEMKKLIGGGLMALAIGVVLTPSPEPSLPTNGGWTTASESASGQPEHIACNRNPINGQVRLMAADMRSGVHHQHSSGYQWLAHERSEPTEMAGVADAETESAYAWALDYDDPDEFPTQQRMTPRRITSLGLAASLVLIAVAGVVALGVLRQPGSPHVAAVSRAQRATVVLPDEPPPNSGCSGAVIGHSDVKHPQLGMVRVFLFLDRSQSTGPHFAGCALPVTHTGRVLPAIGVDAFVGDGFGFANPATDATGNMFIKYLDASNSNYSDGGVVVLIPNTDGFEHVVSYQKMLPGGGDDTSQA